MIEKIKEKQKEFQKMVGIPIDTVVEDERNRIGNDFLSKAIEEICELKKEFPDTLNKYSRTIAEGDRSKLLAERADVELYLCNFDLTFHITEEEKNAATEKKQNKNFLHIKQRQLEELKREILSIPGYTCRLGNGNLSPKKVYISQLPIDEITVDENTEYYTSLCKNVDNPRLEDEDKTFWQVFLDRELEILKANNPEMEIIYV